MTLAVWCSGLDCGHCRVVDVERYGDDVPVPWFGPRMRCGRCGHLGAEAPPNWQERVAVEVIIVYKSCSYWRLRTSHWATRPRGRHPLGPAFQFMRRLQTKDQKGGEPACRDPDK